MAYFTASVDPPDVNKKFAESLELDYPILSDPGKEVARAYGVVSGERTVAMRWTFYIGKDGKILYIDKEVKPALGRRGRRRSGSRRWGFSSQLAHDRQELGEHHRGRPPDLQAVEGEVGHVLEQPVVQAAAARRTQAGSSRTIERRFDDLLDLGVRQSQDAAARRSTPTTGCSR